MGQRVGRDEDLQQGGLREQRGDTFLERRPWPAAKFFGIYMSDQKNVKEQRQGRQLGWEDPHSPSVMLPRPPHRRKFIGVMMHYGSLGGGGIPTRTPPAAEGGDVVWLDHAGHAGGRPSRQTQAGPSRPTTCRLRKVGGLALCASVQFGPGRAAASQALSAGPLSGLDVRPCVNTRYFSLRLTSAYPCHKLSPTSTERFQACISREVSALLGTEK